MSVVSDFLFQQGDKPPYATLTIAPVVVPYSPLLTATFAVQYDSMGKYSTVMQSLLVSPHLLTLLENADGEAYDFKEWLLERSTGAYCGSSGDAADSQHGTKAQTEFVDIVYDRLVRPFGHLVTPELRDDVQATLVTTGYAPLTKVWTYRWQPQVVEEAA